jgi:flagellin-like protein
MKGISAVIATILMLLITLTLAGVAYMFISGTFTSQMQGIEITYSSCSNNVASFLIKNIGTTNITTINCVQTAPANDTCSLTFNPALPLEPGRTTTATDTCSGSGGRACLYVITPSGGRGMDAITQCT